MSTESGSLRESTRPVWVVSDPEILGGTPVVIGTRIPAHLVLVLVNSCTHEEILAGYPTLATKDIEAVAEWARENSQPPPKPRPWRANG